MDAWLALASYRALRLSLVVRCSSVTLLLRVFPLHFKNRWSHCFTRSFGFLSKIIRWALQFNEIGLILNFYKSIRVTYRRRGLLYNWRLFGVVDPLDFLLLFELKLFENPFYVQKSLSTVFTTFILIFGQKSLDLCKVLTNKLKAGIHEFGLSSDIFLILSQLMVKRRLFLHSNF